MERPEKPIRWWPLFIVITLALLGTIATWISDAGHRQDKILLTSMIVIVTIVLSLLWLLFFSELRWHVKLIALAVMGLGVFLGTNLYQFKGFNGDLVPVFERRWQEKQTTFRMVSGERPQSSNVHNGLFTISWTESKRGRDQYQVKS